jgi:hypothetical protein
MVKGSSSITCVKIGLCNMRCLFSGTYDLVRCSEMFINSFLFLHV